MCLLLLWAGLADASPFAEVPSGHWAYSACVYLADQGMIKNSLPSDFAGRSLLTRYEFGLALLEPLDKIEALVERHNSINPAARYLLLEADDLQPVVSRLGESGMRLVGRKLTRLVDEFRDVLTLLGRKHDVLRQTLSQFSAESKEIEKWAAASTSHTPSSSSGETANTGAAGISYSLGESRVGVSYRSVDAGTGLRYLPMVSDPILGTTIISRALARDPAETEAENRFVTRRLSLGGLGGSVEYGLTDNLTVSLGYEALVREGQLPKILEGRRRRTVGIGYRLSPDALVRLRYHLIDYADKNVVGNRGPDRLAESELSISF